MSLMEIFVLLVCSSRYRKRRNKNKYIDFGLFGYREIGGYLWEKIKNTI